MIDNDKTYNYEGHSVDFFSEKTISFLRKRKKEKQPFFCFVPFNGPYGHWPAIKGKAKNKFADMYDNCELNTVPREGLNSKVLDRYTRRVLETNGRVREQFKGPILLPNDKESLRNYFSQSTLIDDGIGRIINEIKLNGLYENTLIIYTSDHGFSLGNHGVWGHGLAAWPSSMHRPSYNIPLIISGPSIVKGVSKKLVSQLDIPNTVLNYIGFNILENKLSDSKVIDLTSLKTDHRESVFIEQEESRAMRTKEWLYVERFNKIESIKLEFELYNLLKDHDERENLFSHENNSTEIKKFSLELKDYFINHSNPKYDLWHGGSAKSNVANENFWKKNWGESWKCEIQ